MKDKETLHRKVQELIDCFATADPLKEMWLLKKTEADEEAPLKWLALAVLHGINAGAKEISVIRSDDGGLRVEAEYRKAELPGPGSIIGERIFESLRRITHMEGDKGKTVLAMGVREGSIDLSVKIDKGKEGEKLTLKFPEDSSGAEESNSKKKKEGKAEKAQSQGSEVELDYCRFAAAAEHGRGYREEEPCYDATKGDYEKRIETEK
jgi:hypothetical protein